MKEKTEREEQETERAERMEGKERKKVPVTSVALAVVRGQLVR